MGSFEQPVTPLRAGRGRFVRAAAVAAAAVALMAVAAVAVSPSPNGPSPSVAVSIALGSPTAGSTSSVPLATVPWHGGPPPPGPTVPVPTPLPTVPPTYPPDAFLDQPEWRVSLAGAGARDQVVALVVDPGRRVIGAGPAEMRFFTAGFTGGVLPAPSDRAVDVYWRSSVCAAFETVTLEPGGTIGVVTTTPDTGCQPAPSMRGLELRFATRVEATAFSLVVGPENHYPPDFPPAAVAFSDATHGVMAIANGLAGVAETADGGESWRYTLLGDGTATGVALSGRTVWTAISCDPSVWDHCAGGVYRRVNGVWARVLAMNPGPMAVEGDTVAVLEQALTVMGDSTAHWTTAIRLTRDGGATWASLGNPCPTAQGWLSAAAFDDGGLLAVCEAEGAGGGAQKGLLASADLTGTRWTVRSRLPQPGTGMGLSLQPRSGTSLQPVSAGLLWGPRSPLLTTADGGITWTAHRDVADGDVRIVRSADAAPGGVDSALVWDPDRGATLLLLSTDRAQTWRELTSFRMLPCCGG